MGRTPKLTGSAVRRYRGFVRPLLILGLLVSGAHAASVDDTVLFDRNVIREWESAEYPVKSQRGKQALAIKTDQWQHLQSSHFILHFFHKGVAVRTAQEAEFYLGKLRETLDWTIEHKVRSHIFIFENEEDWKAFTKTSTIDPWTGGFFDGLDLYYWRKTGMGVLHSDRTLPHEIAHRIMFEKYPRASLPLALHEGYAEYEARKLSFRYLRVRGYDVRVISKRVPQEQFIPAEKLVAMTTYPAKKEEIEAFYDLSERLVHFLVEQHGMAKFRELLDRVARAETFQLALLKVYPRDYPSLYQFEREFQKYAILDTE